MTMEADEQGEIRWRRAIPALRLLGGMGLALDGRKLLLAVLGLVLTWTGWNALDRVFPGSKEVTPLVIPRVPLGAVRASIDPFVESARIVADPLRLPALPLWGVFELGGGTPRFVHALLAVLWVILVWGLIGGAIARIAVVEVATGRRIGLVPALRFAIGKLGPLVMTPLGPLLGIAFLAALCGLIGLLYQIPGEAGPAIAGALAFLPLAAGLVMALLLVGMAAGWPLAVASVAAEAQDTFDALSRSFSYVSQRAVAYAVYAAVAWLVGTIGFPLVVLLARLVLHLTAWGLAFGAPDGFIAGFFGGLQADPRTLPATLHSGWVSLVTLLTYGWVYSYVWSAAAQIYLLLRYEVDGKPLNQIAPPGR
jgi:hypothetical protein